MPGDPRGFPFPALTYFAESPADRMAYITLFPIGATMRANLFGYRDLHDPWLKQLRNAPRETLYAMWPGLRPLMGDFTVPEFVKIRPVDLYVTKAIASPAWCWSATRSRTSCPAAGTGARKVLVDVERLCNVHIPRWLETPGMGAEKIAAFYDDPVKQASDAYSHREGLRAALVHARHVARRRGAALDQVRAALGQGHVRQHRGAAAADRNVADDDEQRRRSRRAAPRRTNNPIAQLLLDREADHRSVVDAVGVLRRRHAPKF